MILKLVLMSQAKCDTTEFPLREDSYTVGRKPENDLRIQECCVSAYHAKVNRTPDGGYEVKDLDSSNGTYLNRKRVSSPVKIKPGDHLKFGIIKMSVEEHVAEAPTGKVSPSSNDSPLKILSLKDRFTKAKHRKEQAPLLSDEIVEEGEIIHLDEEPLAEGPMRDLSEKVDKLTAAKDLAEGEAGRLREELSRLREQLSEKNADNEKRLSVFITELESSLAAEKLLNDDVKAKNEQFRRKIKVLTLDLGNSEEEVTRLKAINARKFTLPDDLSKEGADFARVKEELAFSHDDNADLQAEITALKSDLANAELALAEKELEESSTGDSAVPELQREIEDLKARLLASQAVSESIVGEKEGLTQSQEELQRQLDTAEQAVKEAAEREVGLRKNHATLLAKLKALEGGAVDQKELQNRLTSAAEAAKKSAELEINLRQVNSSLAKKLKEAEERTLELETRVEEGASSDSEKLKLIESLKKKLKESESHSEAQANLEIELESAQKRTLEVEAELAQLRERFTAVEAEAQQVKELESRLASIGAEAQQAEKLKEKLVSVESEAQQVGDLKEKLARSEAKAKQVEELKKKLAAVESEAQQVERLKEKLTSIETEAQKAREKFEASEDQRSDIDVLLSAKSKLASEQAIMIEQLRDQITETKQTVADSENKLVETHRKETELHREEMKTLEAELESSKQESKSLGKELERLQSDMASLKDNTAKEQTQQSLEQETKLSEVEKCLAESNNVREQIESANEKLKEQLRDRDTRIASMSESSESLDSRIESVEKEKSQLASMLQLTREGLSGALRSTRARQIESTRELESEIVRRVRLETQLRKSEAARKGLREEIEALQAETDEGVVLSPEDTGSSQVGGLFGGNAEELRAFEARLETLNPSQTNRSGGKRDFNEVEFYRNLVEKLDLIDEIIQQYETKWRFSKIIKQLVSLKESFLELLEGQSVKLFHLEEGTPLCMNQTHRLELVPREDGSEPKVDPFGKTEVVETVSPGYMFHDGSRDLVIKKARVVVN